MTLSRKKSDASLDIESSDDGLAEGVVLAIGCNRYDTVQDLKSAEADAASVYAALTSGPSALYDANHSMLLRSPTRAEVDVGLRDILKRSKHVGAFVVYFAGHGEVSDESLYLCPSDTTIDALSVTAISIAQILRAICELRPRHAYLIIDACFSGAVSLDLSTVLRADVLDRSPGFSLSILTSAHRLKKAGETPEGGVFTGAFLKALTGEYVVSTRDPVLGLSEIVRKLRMSPVLKSQEPTFWDLNVAGPDSFCRNPLFMPALGEDKALGRVDYPHSMLSGDTAHRIWQKYLDAPHIDLAALPELFRRVVDEQSQVPTAMEAVAGAIAGSFARALEAHKDAFAPALARGAMVLALMPHRECPEASRAIAHQLELVRASVREVLADLKFRIEADRYYLLGRSGFADLFYLPLRISQLFGWVGLLMYGGGTSELAALRGFVQVLLARYGNSVVAVGDDQASGFLTFLSQCKALGWAEEAEEVIGRLYLDFNENFGRVMGNNAQPADVVEYLLLKASSPPESDAEFLQAPSELLSVILIGACLFDLDEAIDGSLIELDHASFSFYVPTSYGEFWRSEMEDGNTLVFQLGHGLRAGYGVWTVQDMHRSWRHEMVPLLDAARADCDVVDLNAAVLASLVLRDRVAWFTVPLMAARVAIPRAREPN